jgi:hypothetical protein
MDECYRVLQHRKPERFKSIEFVGELLTDLALIRLRNIFLRVQLMYFCVG